MSMGIFFGLGYWPCHGYTADIRDLEKALKSAMAAEKLSEVISTVAAIQSALGPRAGVPEVRESYLKVPSNAAILTPKEAYHGFEKYLRQLPNMSWWQVGNSPRYMPGPLREPASLIAGGVAAARAKLSGHPSALSQAKDAADFLIWAQERAGHSLYPFPASVAATNKRAMLVMQKVLKRIDQTGHRDRMIQNDWFFQDMGDGGLQFDNGECGAAMLDLYLLTREPRYLHSALKAAEWALAEPLCTNWNYNSFSVFFLAKIFSVTQDSRFLEAAVHKTMLGVIPGQLREGHFTGRWVDPHNARSAYHYIMMRALAQLVGVLPAGHPQRPEVLAALARGLKSRNQEIIERGVMNKDKAMEALLLARQAFIAEPEWLSETYTQQALEAVSLLVSTQAREGMNPLSPNAWGRFLEYVGSSTLKTVLPKGLSSCRSRLPAQNPRHPYLPAAECVRE